MRFLVLLALAFFTSLDSMGVGVAFGLSGTRIRSSAHVVISLVMLVITGASVALGNRLATIMPDRVSHDLSAILFVGVGVGMLIPLIRAIREGHFTVNNGCDDCCAMRAAKAARQVGVTEALLLGLMLSINNIGGGVSAGLIHIDAFAMATLSVFFNVLLLVAGHSMGNLLRRTPIQQWAQVVAAMTMVAIGIYQLH